MNWNEAAEELLHAILSRTPRPVRDQTEGQIRGAAEALAAEDGNARVGVQLVVKAWIRSTPEALRSELPRQLEGLGLDPADFSDELPD